jgi:hypothetical protein
MKQDIEEIEKIEHVMFELEQEKELEEKRLKQLERNMIVEKQKVDFREYIKRKLGKYTMSDMEEIIFNDAKKNEIMIEKNETEIEKNETEINTQEIEVKQEQTKQDKTKRKIMEEFEILELKNYKSKFNLRKMKCDVVYDIFYMWRCDKCRKDMWEVMIHCDKCNNDLRVYVENIVKEYFKSIDIELGVSIKNNHEGKFKVMVYFL